MRPLVVGSSPQRSGQVLLGRAPASALSGGALDLAWGALTLRATSRGDQVEAGRARRHGLSPLLSRTLRLTGAMETAMGLAFVVSRVPLGARSWGIMSAIVGLYQVACCEVDLGASWAFYHGAVAVGTTLAWVGDARVDRDLGPALLPSGAWSLTGVVCGVHCVAGLLLVLSAVTGRRRRAAGKED